MSLSRIYRGADAAALEPFEFRSFGGDAAAGGKAPVAPGNAAPQPVPTGSGAASEQQLKEAYARGFQEGRAAGEERLDNAAQALAEALEEVTRLRESLARSSRRDMLRLVMAVAEQILRREVRADSQVVLQIIEHALQESVRADHYRVRVNPVDLQQVTERKPLFLASISGLKNLSIETDETISAGGCRVDSELGDVDATLETQLESIRAALEEAIAEDG